MTNELETNIVAVERIKEYTEQPTEVLLTPAWEEICRHANQTLCSD